MDLAPYAAINPCGYEGMAVTQLRPRSATMSPGEWDTER
jgi:lipoate-protein ligase B